VALVVMCKRNVQYLLHAEQRAVWGRGGGTVRGDYLVIILRYVALRCSRTG